MDNLQEIEKIYPRLTKAEKTKLLTRIVQDLGDTFPDIEKRLEVAGGEAVVVRTRIPVWVLVKSRNEGMSEAEILQNYPTLSAENLANAWAYYNAHKEEIDPQIEENEEA